MIPTAFVPLAAMPLTPNGKIDRKALSRKAVTLQSGQAYVAPRTATEATLATIWQAVLGVERLGIDDNFFDFGGHSLLALNLVGDIEQRLNVKLPVSALFENPTLREFTPIFVASEYRGLKHPLPVIPLQPKGSGPPLFCVHPAGGDAFCYTGLAQALREQRPVYGLQAKGLEENEDCLESIEAMASYYLEAITAIQADGPYHLLGWSFGGLIAYEMAQQLSRRGRKTGLLALLDTGLHMAQPEPMPDDRTLVARQLCKKMKLTEMPEPIQQLQPEEQLRQVVDMAKSNGLFPANFGMEQTERILRVFRACIRDSRNYRAQAIDQKR